ncbi:hypothetical protein DI396_02820 [Litorivita pollutaquae]|uniref:Uncharacterized protein n=1 Tax=Litorivita pollutaquae TaxID=2200892 RepID=A0A2V4N2J5_9RHOB|nr:hypothetical protein DI396_02820 [Litorivita pollutaquae]
MAGPAAVVLPTALTAQQVSDCEGGIARADNLMEPWEETSRTFSGGRTRIAVLDRIEPALGAFHLMILSPPFDALGARQCRVVSYRATMGFARLRFEDLQSTYDPLKGLGLRLPVESFDGQGDAPVAGQLQVIVNQATGEISATLEAAQ